jgi:nicotinamidase-related amidase
MSQIIIPNPSRTRALMIIDVQPGFIKSEHAIIVENIAKLIKEGGYDFFVVAEFRAIRGGLWDQQAGYTFAHTSTPSEIMNLLDPERTLIVIKNTKSVFNMKPYLAAELRMKDIEEIHCVGCDINDCVLATANDAFDLGFYSYVIEECAGSSESLELREAALAILRENEMTNHSELIVDKKILDVVK